MKIYNTVPYFLENFMPTEQFLKQYHEKFPLHFKEYFLYHCKNPDEKLRVAIQKYPSKFNEIEEISGKMEQLIHQVISAYTQKYQVAFTKCVHIIVGAYGSNAFTHRQIIPEVTFCLEQLSSNDNHLKVIIAHEFGHALHNILSDSTAMDWSKIQWSHPYTWLLQEGTATYFSMEVTDAEESVYFSYNGDGEDWLQFAKGNKRQILTAFMEDFNDQTPVQVFREWFSINGGTHFGYSRLGYFLGYCILERLVEKYQEHEAVTIWKEPIYLAEIEKVLLELLQEWDD